MSEQIGFKPITGLNETSLNKIIEMSGKELAEKSYVDAAVSNVTAGTTNLATKSELRLKVDKEEGKGLSTEDFTTEYKNKLEGLSNTGVSDEQISTAVNNYFTKHPVSGGATAEQVAQIEANRTAIGDTNSGLIKEVNNIAKSNNDRGAMRVCVWGEKVTRMLNSLVNRYIEKGEEIFEDSEVWLCTTCGFIFIGKNPPEKCPVCKVPSSKFEKIEGGVL